MIDKCYVTNNQMRDKIVGKSKSFIIDLFGQECNDLHEATWIYRIDKIGFLGFRRHMKVVFDENNIVISVKII